MALPIEQLYKARDFLNLKNISANHVELSFKNPVIAMLAKGKVAEIASQCSPTAPSQNVRCTATICTWTSILSTSANASWLRFLMQRRKEQKTLPGNWLHLWPKKQ